MAANIVKHLKGMAHSRGYWLALIVAGLALLATALVYQYALDEQPCVLCIQVRLWITLLVIVSTVGLLFRNSRLMNSVAHLSTVLIAIALTERSYQLLGTERGFVLGVCNFDLGLPAWFAIEKWLPGVYRVETSCGYTPEIVFGITMAEALIVMSVCLLLISLGVFLASLSNATKSGDSMNR